MIGGERLQQDHLTVECKHADFVASIEVFDKTRAATASQIGNFHAMLPDVSTTSAIRNRLVILVLSKIGDGKRLCDPA